MREYIIGLFILAAILLIVFYMQKKENLEKEEKIKNDKEEIEEDEEDEEKKTDNETGDPSNVKKDSKIDYAKINLPIKDPACIEYTTSLANKKRIAEERLAESSLQDTFYDNIVSSYN